MKFKSIIVLAALLLLAGCGKTPAPSESAEVPPNSSAITEAATVPSQELVSREPVETVAVTESSSVFQTEAEAISTTETKVFSSTEAEADSQSVQTEVAPAETKHPDAPAPSQPLAQSEPQKDTEPKTTNPAPTPTQPTEPKPTNPPHTHSYKTKTVSPTCTEKGYTEHTCSCGDSYKDGYTEALGHSFTEQTVAATCTSSGYTLRTCFRCKATETTNSTPALGHDYRDSVVPPTTSSQGYTEHTCSRCGDSFRDSYTEKLKVVYDIYQAMEAGNSYARGRGCEIDTTMTTGNSSYYPANEMTGSMLAAHGGQADLNAFAVSKVESTINHLVALDGTEELLPYTRIRCYVQYHESTDSYEIWVLYG